MIRSNNITKEIDINLAGFDDDEDDWIPMSDNKSTSDNHSQQAQHINAQASNTTKKNSHDIVTKIEAKETKSIVNTSTHLATSERRTNNNLQLQQIRFSESRVKLHEDLLVNPMDSFLRKFIWYMMNELLWNNNKNVLMVLAGYFLILTGTLLNSFLSGMKHMIYTTVLSILVSTVLIYHQYFHDRAKPIKSTNHSDDHTKNSDDTELTMKKLQVMMLFFYLLPTFIEMRILFFFVMICQQTSFSNYYYYTSLITIYIIQIYLFHHYVTKAVHKSQKNVTGTGVISLESILRQMDLQKLYQHQRTLLQISTYIILAISIIATKSTLFSKSSVFIMMINVSGPVFLVVGEFLLSRGNSNCGEDGLQTQLSNILRTSLKLALRDVLLNLNDNISNDEMLQLAMLRWIVDYWAYISTSSSTNTTTNNNNNNSNTPANDEKPTNTTTQKQHSKDSFHHQQQQEDNDLSWSELSHMLQTTTTLMEQEAVNYNNNNNNHHHESYQKDQKEAVTNETEYTSQNNLNSHSSSSANSSQSQSESSQPSSLSSPIYHLKTLLNSIDEDKDAKLAVLHYKSIILNIPPPPKISLCAATMTHVPACLTLLWTCSNTMMMTTIWQCFLLMPLALIEVALCFKWSEVVRELNKKLIFSDNNDNEVELDGTVARTIPTPREISSYSIALLTYSSSSSYYYNSEDNDNNRDTLQYHCLHHQPILFRVWLNLLQSTYVLEQALKGVKITKTGFIAQEFCENVKSLSSLGIQVYQKGWVHGLSVIGQELIFSGYLERMFHNNDNEKDLNEESGDTNYPEEEKDGYVNNAINLFHNGQKVLQNVTELMNDNDDDDEHQQKHVDNNKLQHAILNGVSVVFGNGWLWNNNSTDYTDNENERVEKTKEAKKEPHDGIDDNNDTNDVKEDNNNINTSLTSILREAIQETTIKNKSLREEEIEQDNNDKNFSYKNTISSSSDSAGNDKHYESSDNNTTQTTHLNDCKDSNDKVKAGTVSPSSSQEITCTGEIGTNHARSIEESNNGSRVTEKSTNIRSIVHNEWSKYDEVNETTPTIGKSTSVVEGEDDSSWTSINYNCDTDKSNTEEERDIYKEERYEANENKKDNKTDSENAIGQILGGSMVLLGAVGAVFGGIVLVKNAEEENKRRKREHEMAKNSKDFFIEEIHDDE